MECTKGKCDQSCTEEQQQACKQAQRRLDRQQLANEASKALLEAQVKYEARCEGDTTVSPAEVFAEAKHLLHDIRKAQLRQAEALTAIALSLATFADHVAYLRARG
jgi:hypothetical protein